MCVYVCVCVCVCVSLSVMSDSDFCVHGILQEVYWSGLPFPPPGDLLDPCLLHFLNLQIFILQTNLLCSVLDSLSFLSFFLINHIYGLFQGTGSQDLHGGGESTFTFKICNRL